MNVFPPVKREEENAPYGSGVWPVGANAEEMLTIYTIYTSKREYMRRLERQAKLRKHYVYPDVLEHSSKIEPS